MDRILVKLDQDFPCEIIGSVPLSIIYCPKNLLKENNLPGYLEKKGFTVLGMEPYGNFRLNYEEKYRETIEQEKIETFSLVLITRQSLNLVDYDIWKIAEDYQRIFDYSFSEIYPPILSSLEQLSYSTPNSTEEWQKYALNVGKVIHQYVLSKEYNTFPDIYMSLLNKINESFFEWCNSSYSTMLTGQTYITEPKSLNNILPHLAYILRKEKSKKIALIVMDGMSIDQWFILKNVFKNKTNWAIRESAIFAMLPSLTNVSRQAIFSGKLPREFKETINHNRKEKDYWLWFWENQDQQIAVYIPPKADEYLQIQELLNSIKDAKFHILGTVIPIVDELMHHSLQGQRGFYDSIKLWLSKGVIEHLFATLFEYGFEIILTADHGNIEAIPAGNLTEGIIADTKGQRVRIYDRESARNKAITSYDGLVKINTSIYALPDDYLPLVHEKAHYFGSIGNIITHGGASLQEVIVPYIHIKRN